MAEHDASTPSDDIRLLGRLLGDVVREQAGDETFNLIENVRRLAVDGHRTDSSSIEDLTTELQSVDIDDALHVIRAFGWLARSRILLRMFTLSADGGLILMLAMDTAQAQLQALSSDSLLQEFPDRDRIGAGHLVGTCAHGAPDRSPSPDRSRCRRPHCGPARPTIVQGGKSSVVAEIDDTLRLEILTLWQTAVLRLSKLAYVTKSETLRHYRSSLFEVIPALQAEVASVAKPPLIEC